MRTVDTREYLDQVCAMLREGTKGVPVPVAGDSMVPFLRPQDTVYLDLPTAPPEKGDILLFTRASGQYVLHRVVKLEPQGLLWLLGDNQLAPEPVPADRVCAIASAACCGGRYIKADSFRWWFFAHVWYRLVPLRRILARLRARLHK